MDNEVYCYKKLNVWKKAGELAFQIYSVTKNFPHKEGYLDTPQYKFLEQLGSETGKLLWRFYESIKL